MKVIFRNICKYANILKLKLKLYLLILKYQLLKLNIKIKLHCIVCKFNEISLNFLAVMFSPVLTGDINVNNCLMPFLCTIETQKPLELQKRVELRKMFISNLVKLMGECTESYLSSGTIRQPTEMLKNIDALHNLPYRAFWCICALRGRAAQVNQSFLLLEILLLQSPSIYI